MKQIEGLNRKILLAFGIAAVVAVMVAFWLWSQETKFKVLFSNYSDKDGGSIVTVLEQMNIPYKISDGGGAILVPAEQVHQVRLKLASMGLPKGGNVGFELLENQKFGVSQFVEQVNFQRALVGELERSIQAISVIENARVHLAIPKAAIFVRDQEKPTASVLIRLHAGRTLDERQVSAIIHLVASSVPNLPISNVAIVDQNGNLLSDMTQKKGPNYVDPSQIKYIEDLQRNIVMRVESIITPMLGAKNIHAQASAEVDFSSQEQAEEIFKPNKNPDAAVIRSLQSNESNLPAVSASGGVPGALSNQPPASGTAPISTEPLGQVAGVDSKVAPVGTSGNSQKNSTTNYEVDKTVRHTQKYSGGIKRLTVAVVVNDRQETDKEGKQTSRPLTDDEKKQINDLARQAMGFSEARGDSLSVVNTSFAPEKIEIIESIPVWKNTTYIELLKDGAKLLLGLVVLYMLYKRALKPMVAKLLAAPASAKLIGMDTEPGGDPTGSDTVLAINHAQIAYQQDLDKARLLARDNPKLVAKVVTSWVSGNG